MKKAVEVAKAKARRAKLLADFGSLKESMKDLTQNEFARMRKITPQRMSQLLSKAVAEQ